MKKLMLTLLTLSAIILLVGTVSGATWDNWKYYDEETKTIIIKNNFILKDLEKATLISNTYNCAETCLAEKEITLYEDGVLIDDLKFYRLFTDGSREIDEPRSYSLRYLIDVGEVFLANEKKIKNGTIIKKYERNFNGVNLQWRDYELGTEVKAGTYQVRLEGKKKVNKIYDWIITLQGKEITEWATWGNISLGDQAEVLLKAPVDNFRITTIGDVISFNATANITGGSKLTNMSFYSNHGGTWKLNETFLFTPSVVGDVGEPATDRGVIYGPGLTLLNLGNPASGTYTCTEVQIFLGSQFTINVTVGSFFGATDTWESRDWVTLGAIDNGTLVTVSDITIDFESGDVIGMFDHSGGASIEADASGGSNIRYKASNQFGTGEQGSYILLADDVESVNCTAIEQTTTFSAQNYSKSVTEEIIWNVEACDTDSDCGFATSNRTVSLPLNAPNITATAPPDAYNTTDQTIAFNVTANDDINLVNISIYIDGIINQTNSSPINNTLTTFNIVVGDGDHTWSAIAFDNNSESANSTIFTFTVDSSAPEITVTFPNETFNFHEVNTNLFVNWTTSDLNLDSCILEYEGVNTTVTCLDNQTTINITNSVNRSLIFYVNDTFGNLNSSSVSWNYLVLQTLTTFNSSDFQTANQRFTVNVTTNGSAITAGSLTFDGTENTGATITNLVGDDYSITRTITIPIIEGSITHNFNLTISGKVINTTQQTMVINVINFALCNSTLTTPFINITFKNETLAEENIAATISSTWVFSLTALSGVNKTLTFTNASENANYLFCGTPNRTMNVNINIDYNNGLSQQRSFTSIRTISNLTATQVLYLLPTSLGIFSPFKTTNINGDTVSLVGAVITRVLNAVVITVANGLTDSSGFATFFLDPDVTHTATFTKIGFADNIFTFTPATDLRTVVMGGGGVISNGTVISRGTTWTITPRATTLPNNTITTFTFNVTSNLTTISLISMNITNSSRHELLFVSNAGVGNLSGTLDTGNNTKLFGNFLIQTGEETITVTKTWDIFTTFAGDYSIFTQFTLAKDNALITEFMRLLIVLAFMSGVLIFMNVGKLIETSESNIAVLLLMAWAFSLVGWLDTGLAVSTTNTGINILGEFSNQYGIAILLTLPGLFFILRRLFIRIPR